MTTFSLLEEAMLELDFTEELDATELLDFTEELEGTELEDDFGALLEEDTAELEDDLGALLEEDFTEEELAGDGTGLIAIPEQRTSST
jgi:hypothetical protein